MRLLVRRQEAMDRPEVGIPLGGDRPRLGKIVRDASRRREIEILDALIRVVEDRIDEDVPGAKVHAEDRADFGRIALRVPMLRIEAEFEIHRIDEHTVVGVRHGEEFAQLPPIERAAARVGDAIERKIKPLLEPVGDPERRETPGSSNRLQYNCCAKSD